MKSLLAFIVSITLSTGAWSQADSIPTQSFERIYSRTIPTLKYLYDHKNQVHDYSGNWDLDKDGKTDRLLFIGTGGAHLYYYLRIVLSSDTVERNFTYLTSDMPVVASHEELAKLDFDPLKLFPRFAVYDFNGDGTLDIFMDLDDQSFYSSPKQLKKHGIRSSAILISVKGRKVKLSEYRPSRVLSGI